MKRARRVYERIETKKKSDLTGDDAWPGVQVWGREERDEEDKQIDREGEREERRGSLEAGEKEQERNGEARVHANVGTALLGFR